MTGRTKGALCLLASGFGFALMAALVRLCDDCGAPLSSFQKSFFRNLVALVIAAIVFARTRQNSRHSSISPSHPPIFPSSHPPIFPSSRSPILPSSRSPVLPSSCSPVLPPFLLPLVLRAALGTAGIFANFYALSHIPIAEGQTLNKTAPFFTVLFSWLFLNERANRRQVLSLVAAFAGVVLVAKPGFAGEEAFPLLMGLFGGLCAGSAYGCVHWLGRLKVNGAFIVLFFSVFSCLASVPFVVADYTPMTLTQLAVLLGVGAGAAIGQFGITAAYRFAEPRQIAVLDNCSVLFAALFGFLLFGQVPDLCAVAGFVLIVLASLRMRRA